MGSPRRFDLCVLGSGSGNSLITPDFDDWSVALVERGTFGGTCLNVGCIPTKMFVVPAYLAASPAEAQRLGVDLRFAGADWPAIRDRIFGRIDPISEGGERWREENANVTLFRVDAEFTGPKRLRVGEQEIVADRFVLASGSRAVLPDIPGLDTVSVHTSDTIMRLPELPESLLVIGGGFIAAELAGVFAAFGTEVTVAVRGERMLRHEDGEISQRFTEAFGARVNLLLGHEVTSLAPAAGGRIRATVSGPDGKRELVVSTLLAATGRVPNSASFERCGVRLAEDGRVEVDEYQRTNVEGVYALGDVSSPYQLKHVANHEMRVVQHNLLHPDDLERADHRFVPHAVFAEPQVASVGLTEEQARERDVRYVSASVAYGDVAYGWALEDTVGVCKVLADPATGRLLGAHLMGEQASTLIQPLIQALSFGLDVRSMARGQYWIHPALPEVIENALLALELDGGGVQ